MAMSSTTLVRFKSFTSISRSVTHVGHHHGRHSRTFSTTTKAQVPPRTKVSPSERAALRLARKQQAAQSMQAQSEAAVGTGVTAASGSTGTATTTTTNAAAVANVQKPLDSRLIFGLGVGIPAALLSWGIADEDSPPAKFSKMIGFTKVVEGFADQFARPSREKLLPDWPVS
jgi:hypothetical protein